MYSTVGLWVFWLISILNTVLICPLISLSGILVFVVTKSWSSPPVSEHPLAKTLSISCLLIFLGYWSLALRTNKDPGISSSFLLLYSLTGAFVFWWIIGVRWGYWSWLDYLNVIFCLRSCPYTVKKFSKCLVIFLSHDFSKFYNFENLPWVA